MIEKYKDYVIVMICKLYSKESNFSISFMWFLITLKFFFSYFFVFLHLKLLIQRKIIVKKDIFICYF